MKQTCLWPMIGILLGVTIIWQSHIVSERLVPTLNNPDCHWCDTSERADQVRFIPSNPLFIRLAAPADPQLLADLLWFRLGYYFGAHAISDRSYEHLYFLLNQVTDLSPRWSYPYLTGAIMLYLEAQDPVNSLRLISKGMKAMPELWGLPFFKAYIFWKEFEDYKTASHFLLLAASLKNAPSYLSGLAAKLAKKSGDMEFLEVFREMVDKRVDDPKQRKHILKRLQED